MDASVDCGIAIKKQLSEQDSSGDKHGKAVWLSVRNRLLREHQPPAAAAAALDLLQGALLTRDGRLITSGNPSTDPSKAVSTGFPDAALCVRALLGRTLAAMSQAALPGGGGDGTGEGSGIGYQGWATGGAGVSLRRRAVGIVAQLVAHCPAAFQEVRLMRRL